MFRPNGQVQRLVQALGLKSMPIGAKFSETPDERGICSQLRICEALDSVKREKMIINLSKENCTCPGGRHIAGWQALSLEELSTIFMEANVYKSKRIAEASVSKQPKPTYRGKFLILGPLIKFQTNPDLVLFFANPAQAERILGLTSFEGIKQFMHYPASSVCSTISNTLTKKKPDINLISMFERTRHKWPSSNLIVSLPFKDFMTAAKSVDHSGYGRKAKS
jgi:uncharacterized protein (DUF169 family)